VEWEEEFSYDCTGSAGATSAPCACMHAHVRPLSTPRWRFPTDTTCKKYAHTVSTSSPSMAEPRRNFARRRRTQQTSQTTGCAHTRAHTDTNGHIHVHSRLTKSVWMQFAQSSLALLRLSLRTEKVLVCACASGIGSRIFSARTDNAAASESPIATACACLRIWYVSSHSGPFCLQADDTQVAAHKRKLGFINISLCDWAGKRTLGW